MSNSNQDKPGFPVLVYLNPSQPLSLSFKLRIQHDAACERVTFMLSTAASPFLEGASDEHRFLAQYDADNFDSTPNKPAQLHVPPTRLDELKRDAGTPDVVFLTLRLKRTCPLWCPRVDVLVATAESSAQASFDELVDLSKALEVHMTLNRKWLTKDHMRIVQIVKSGSETLSSYPVARYYSNLYKQADWTVFAPESPGKRAREVPDPSTPPAYKRTNVNKSPSSTPKPSPTEVDTPASPPDYKRTDANRSPSTPPPIPSPTEAATTPSRSQTPWLFGLYPQENKDDTDVQFQAINHAVELHLPGVLQQLLPNLVERTLPDLFTLPPNFSPYTSDLDTPSPAEPETLQYPRDVTPLGRALLPFVVKHLQPQLQNMISSTLNRGVDSRRQQAIIEIDDAAEDKVHEMHQERDRGMKDVESAQTALREDLREARADWLGALEHHRDEAIEDLREHRRLAVEAVDEEKENSIEALSRHAQDVLIGLKGDAALAAEQAIEDVYPEVTEQAEKLFANTRKHLEVLREDNANTRKRLETIRAKDFADTRKRLETIRDEMFADTRTRLQMIQDKIVCEVAGDAKYRRGRRRGRRAGKGGYCGVGGR